MQLKEADFFVISVTIWSVEGLVDLKSIKWNPLILHPRAILYTSPSSIFDSLYDPERSCDLELNAKWRTGPGDPSGKIIPADYLSPNFERVAIHSSGLEPIYIKAVFRAIKKGTNRA